MVSGLIVSTETASVLAVWNLYQTSVSMTITARVKSAIARGVLAFLFCMLFLQERIILFVNAKNDPFILEYVRNY